MTSGTRLRSSSPQASRPPKRDLGAPALGGGHGVAARDLPHDARGAGVGDRAEPVVVVAAAPRGVVAGHLDLAAVGEDEVGVAAEPRLRRRGAGEERDAAEVDGGPARVGGRVAVADLDGERGRDRAALLDLHGAGREVGARVDGDLAQRLERGQVGEAARVDVGRAGWPARRTRPARAGRGSRRWSGAPRVRSCGGGTSVRGQAATAAPMPTPSPASTTSTSAPSATRRPRLRCGATGSGVGRVTVSWTSVVRRWGR